MNGIEERHETLAAADGTPIFYRRRRAAAEKARLVLGHGLGEHSGRYAELAAVLAEAGISTWLPDHRGHGRSGGRRGHVERFDRYLEDLDRVAALARENLPAGGKCFLLGHSMGGLIAVRYAQKHPRVFDGLVLSSPALGIKVPVPPLKALLAAVTSSLLPWLGMSNGLDADKISRDPQVVRAYREDPLVHDRVSARWFTEFVRAMRAAGAGAPAVRLPVLLQAAGDDHLVSTQAAEEFFGRLGSADKTLRRYPGLYHEIYNAPAAERGAVFGDLLEWLLQRA